MGKGGGQHLEGLRGPDKGCGGLIRAALSGRFPVLLARRDLGCGLWGPRDRGLDAWGERVRGCRGGLGFFLGGPSG